LKLYVGEVRLLNYVLNLLVCKEIGRKRRKVIRTGIGISLSARSVEFEGDDGATPRLACCTGSNVVDSAVDGLAFRKRCWGVPDVERESQRFSTEALRQHNTFGTTFWHVRIEEGHWSCTILGSYWETVDRDDTRTF
jgi:hypothetical protein